MISDLQEVLLSSLDQTLSRGVQVNKLRCQGLAHKLITRP
jgi:hypothetical protein